MAITLNGTTGITDVNGTAAAPAITGTDTDSGVFFGTNTVSLATGGTAAVTVDSSQNVGIGTASPTAKLSIEKSADAASPSRTPADYSIRMTAAQSNTYNGGICVSESTFVNAAITPVDTGASGAQGWAFITGNNTAIAEVTRIDSSGNLLVAATAQYTAEKFNVTQSAAATGILVRLSSGPYNSSSNAMVIGYDGTAARFYFPSNGGLYNYSANNVNLSDVRTKIDIQDAGSYLAKICAIPVRTFKYIDQTDDLLNLGCIAQEVEAVAPELVDVQGFNNEVPEDGIPLKGIYQTDLQYALMKCIQEQQALITSLTDRIAALEAR